MAAAKNAQLRLTQLVLDGENPRHDAIDDEPDIIAKLLAREKVVKLAQHIVAAGGLSPLERTAVMKHPKVADRYIVLEGNRRICALKLLRDPARAPTPSTRRTFDSLRALATKLPATVEVVVYGSRELARPWISLRHEGEQGGAGTVTWKARQKARFNHAGAATSPNMQALQLLDYGRDGQILTEDEIAKISLTTITRYLSNPIVRDVLGLQNGRDLQINVPQDQFERVARRFLRDAIPTAPDEPPAPVNSRSDKDARIAYARSLKTEGVSPTTRTEAPALAVAQKSRSTGGRHSRNPDNRSHIVPLEFKVAIRDPVLKRIFDELRLLPDVDRFSFAGAYLLRAFIEKTAHGYASDHGLGTEGQLHQVIDRCAKRLEADGMTDDKVLSPLHKMSNDKHSRGSPDSLGAWVHASLIPTGAELKRRWDTLEPGLRALLDRLK